MQNTVDRVSLTLDTIDVRSSQLEQQIYTQQIEIQALKSELEAKASKDDLDQIIADMSNFVTTNQLKDVDRKFLKFAKLEKVLEVNAKLEILKEQTTKFAKVDYVTEQIDSLSSDIKEAIQDHITRQAVEQKLDM